MHRALLIVALATAGCWSTPGGTSSDPTHGDLNPGDRKILGVPAPYDADPSLRDRQAELDDSPAARRQVAWATVQKVLAPVALADHPTGTTPTVPRFQTWYAKDDFVRMYKKLYKDLGTDGRKSRLPFGSESLAGIYPWNATMVDTLPSWPADRYAKYVERLTSPETWNGEGAGNRVSYAPGTVDHLFRNYGSVLKCLPRLASLAPDAPPVSDDNFTACYEKEFPLDAVVVKAAWARAEFGAQVPTYDTSEPAMQKRLADPTSDWGPGDGQADPTADQIHTVRLSNGNKFRLVGLHIITKELRKWLWITVWWSPDPDGDFGADRPASLDGVWRNYKMCVATTAGDTWCSNPYLEKGPGNARTNCIGCHQHAGTSLKPEQILAFDDNGRREVRTNFPTDYLFAFDRTDNLSRVIADEAAYYDSIEK